MKKIFTLLFMSITVFGYSSFSLNAQEYSVAEDQSQSSSQEKGEADSQQETVSADKPLEIWTFLNDYRIITGKTLHLTVQVIWKLGVSIDLNELKNVDLSPFKIEGVIIGERQIFDNDHDFAVVTYALSLPKNLELGVYTIPSFSLSYRNEVKETEGVASSSPIPIQKVSVYAEGKIDKDVINIGEKINYTLTVFHKKDINILWEKLDNKQFSPFEVLKKEVTKNSQGDIIKTVINYDLTTFDLGGEERNMEIPALTILYYKKPDVQNGSNDSVVTKDIQTAPKSVLINSLLKSVDAALEGLKGSKLYSKQYTLLYGYLPVGGGVALLLSLVAFSIVPLIKKQRTVIPKQVTLTPQIALNDLNKALMQIDLTKKETIKNENIYRVHRTLRTYLGTLINIPDEKAQALSTSGLIAQNTLNKLSEEASEKTYNVLKQLDSVIFGNKINKESLSKIKNDIEQIINLIGTQR